MQNNHKLFTILAPFGLASAPLTVAFFFLERADMNIFSPLIAQVLAAFFFVVGYSILVYFYFVMRRLRKKDRYYTNNDGTTSVEKSIGINLDFSTMNPEQINAVMRHVRGSIQAKLLIGHEDAAKEITEAEIEEKDA